MVGSAMFVSAALLMCGCHSPNSIQGHSAQDAQSLRLAFIACSADAAFFEPVKKGMRDAAEMLKVQSDFLGTKGVDIPAQVQMVRQAVRAGYDGIALNIIDPCAFDGVIQAAIDAGVPVVGFNVDDQATPNARLSSVNQRLYEAGKSLGKYMLPFVADHAHVLVTMHDEGISALEDRLHGIQEGLGQKNVQWKILITGNNPLPGAEKVAEALKENPDIRVILGTGQADTEAVGRMIEKKNHAGKEYRAAGFDLSPKTLQLIQDGYLLCTIDQQPYLQGFYPVVQLTQYLRYGLMPCNIDTGAAIIDMSNVKDVVKLTRQNIR